MSRDARTADHDRNRRGRRRPEQEDRKRLPEIIASQFADRLRDWRREPERNVRSQKKRCHREANPPAMPWKTHDEPSRNEEEQKGCGKHEDLLAMRKRGKREEH